MYATWKSHPSSTHYHFHILGGRTCVSIPVTVSAQPRDMAWFNAVVKQRKSLSSSQTSPSQEEERQVGHCGPAGPLSQERSALADQGASHTCTPVILDLLTMGQGTG